MRSNDTNTHVNGTQWSDHCHCGICVHESVRMGGDNQFSEWAGQLRMKGGWGKELRGSIEGPVGNILIAKNSTVIGHYTQTNFAYGNLKRRILKRKKLI